MNVQILKKAVMDLLYPQSLFCVLCGNILPTTARHGMCTSCSESLPFIHEPRCITCGKSIIEFNDPKCHDCKYHKHFFDQGISVFEYSYSIQKLIYRYKYYNEYSLASTLAFFMVELLKYYKDWKIDTIIPVPLHSNRRKTRGFNQSALLSNHISDAIGICCYEDVLIRCLDTPTQTNLTRIERRDNLKDAFRVINEKAITGKSVLLVDDVYTTGATADWCSRRLKEAGAAKVYLITLATGSNI